MGFLKAGEITEEKLHKIIDLNDLAKNADNHWRKWHLHGC